ncbi:nesprin-2a [Myripristis murdjan]|uniref:nesprin-2a n=1 Tax=Myripristis murdjan TaxID=586833 RepID=UPI001176250E|nr:nesprin-2-like [Myripristis murdjan]
MASGGAEEDSPLDDGSIPLDIDNVHMLLQVEQEQIQKRTFTNWINAQLAKRCPPSSVSDLFSDLRDGARLLDLLEVMSDQRMKREKGRGVFQQRANIETALNFLKKKSVKLVNINIPDIIDGRPSIILGLIWTIILHCHIEELASTLSFSSRHSSLDSLASLDSWSGGPAIVGPASASPTPPGRTSPLHSRFRISAKKALLMWVRDQCQRAGCSVSVKDFKSSWRSGVAFLAILSSLRPELVDLSLVASRSRQQNLEEAFHLAERELRIPRLLEPQDVDVKDPDEKSIMTYVAQFLQYSNDMPAPDDHLQASPHKRAQEVTCWLEKAYQELSEAWTATEKSSYAEKYEVFQSLAGSLSEQRRPVIPLLGAIKRSPEPSKEQHALRAAWDRLEEKLQRCKAELDLALPPPLDLVVVWLQHAEAALTEEGQAALDHASAAKKARAQQDTLQTLLKEMSHHLNTLHTFHNEDDTGAVIVPFEKFEEVKRSLTNVRVTAKYQGIKLEYHEHRHTVLDLLSCIKEKLHSWKTPYRSQEAVQLLLQDWHETVERQGLVLILMDALQKLKDMASTYTSKAALGDDSQLVGRQVKEAEGEAAVVMEAVKAVRGRMERVLSAWEAYNKCLPSLQAWLTQKLESQTHPQVMTEWSSNQALLNEMGNLLIEVTETSTSLALAEQLSKVNMQWAECMKRTVFEASSEPSAGPPSLQMVQTLGQEANCLLRQPLQVASVPLKANMRSLQSLSKKIVEMDLSSFSLSPDYQASHMETPLQNLTEVQQTLAIAESTCRELLRAASRLEGRLAELSHWTTEALEFYQHLKEREQRGRAGLEPKAKVLISRGLQLESQVVTEGQNLQGLVSRVQKTSPLHHLSTSTMQGRVAEALSQSQEIVEMLSCFGFRQHVGEMSDNQSQTQTEPGSGPGSGSFVVAATKHVGQVGTVELQAHESTQFPRGTPVQTPHQSEKGLKGSAKNYSHSQHISTQEGTTMALPYSKTHIQPQPLIEPTLSQVQSSLAQTPKEDHSEAMTQTPSRTNYHGQAPSSSLKDKHLPTLAQDPGLPSQQITKAQSLILSKSRTSIAREERESSSSRQTPQKLKIRQHLDAQSGNNMSPQPPVMVRSEVHSKAQSMARSRLEKAKFRLQEHIQRAITLFSDKEISDRQAKRKQRALKILRPAVLEEFLGAVEGLGAFSSEAQLQDLMLLSDSVRKQWEDVRTEMTAFVPTLWSNIKGGKQTSSTMECEMHANTLHEATDQTDPEYVQKQQACLFTEGPISDEDRVESLQELCETLAPRTSPILDTDSLKNSGGERETVSKPSKTALPQDSGGQQLRGGTLLTTTSVPAHLQPSNKLTQKPRQDSQQQHHAPLGNAGPLQTSNHSPHGLPPQVQICPPESEDHLPSAKGHAVCGEDPKKDQEPPLHAKDHALKVRLLHSAQSRHQGQAHLQAIVRGDIVESKQEAEWTIIPPEAAPPQEQCSSEQEVVERMASLETTADLMESADGQIALISEKLNKITSEPVDISSLALADPRISSDLKEMDDRLQSEMKTLSGRSTERERVGEGLDPITPSTLCHALHNSAHHLSQLRQRLEKVQSAAEALEGFLATVREAEAQILAILASQEPNRQQNEVVWDQERHSWWAGMQQRLCSLDKTAECVDSLIEAAGMTLTMDGAIVACRDVVASLSRRLEEVDKEVTAHKREENKVELHLLERELKPEKEELNEMCHTKTWDDSPGQAKIQEQEHHTPNGMQLESGLQPKRSRWNEPNEDSMAQREDGQIQEEVKATAQGEGSQGKEDGEKKKKSMIQRRFALLGELREIERATEQLGLQEPTLPAVQQRMRALIALDSRLAGKRSEVRDLCDESKQSGVPAARHVTEVEDVWEETQRKVTERLDQCRALTELLKRFQSVRAELSGTLQRAECAISEQASYMGRDNMQRLYTTVQVTKSELHGLGDGIEDVRSICRQLQTRLRQIPECTIIPFEDEADALMDRWLDVTERTDSHLDNLQLSLALWEGVLQLAGEVESWTVSKLEAFAQSSSFQTEEEVKALQDEIKAQEESVERFQRRAAEIQALLKSTDPLLELQVVETQIKKKMEQVKELFSEVEDVYRQAVAAKGQVSARMAECHDSLQKIQDSLVNLSGTDAANVHAQIQDICGQLQSQEDQAAAVLEDLRLLACIASPESLQSLAVDGIQLQEKLTATHQLLSQVEEQIGRDIQALNRLQRESGNLEQWLQAAEEKAEKEEDLSRLQKEACQQRERTETVSQLVSSLQSSSLQQSVLSTQTWISELQQQVDSPVTKSLSTQSPVEQRLNSVQAVVRVIAEGESRVEELRLTGSRLSHRLTDRVDKQEIQETVQKTEELWSALLKSVQPHCSGLQAEPELTSSLLAQRQEAHCRVEELRRRITQLPSLFSWPGLAERRQASIQAHDLRDETESLGLALATLAEQRRELAERINDPIWADSSWSTLESCQSSLMAELNAAFSHLEKGVCEEERCGQLLQHCSRILTSLQERMSTFQAERESTAELITDAPALEALLKEVTDTERDFSDLIALKDSISSSSTAEAQASLSQQVSSLQNHKGALESCIRKKLAQLEGERTQRVQQVREETSCLQAALRGLAERLGNLSADDDVLTDINQLKQHWHKLQDCDTSLTEFTVRVNELQNIQESKTTQENLPADLILTADALAKELDSLRSSFKQKKQECADSVASGVRELISQLQQWSQTAQAVPAQPSQATLKEVLQLHQALQGALSQQDFLLNCLGKKLTKKLVKSASNVLKKSTPSLEYLLSQENREVELGHKEEQDKDSDESFRSKTLCSISDATMAMYSRESPHHSSTSSRQNTERDQTDSKSLTKRTYYASDEIHPCTEPVKETSGKSGVEGDAGLMQAPKEYSFTQNQHPGTEIPGTFTSKPHEDNLTSSPPKVATADLNIDHTQHFYGTSDLDSLQIRLKNDGGSSNTDNTPATLASGHSQALQSLPGSNTDSLMPDSLFPFNSSLKAQQESSGPLQKITTLILDPKLPADGSENPQKINCVQCVTSPLEYHETVSGVKPELREPSFCVPASKDVSGNLETQPTERSQCESGSQEPKTIKLIAGAEEKEKCFEDSTESPKKMHTIVLDMELPHPQPQGIKQREDIGVICPGVLSSEVAGFCDAHYQKTEVSSAGLPQKKSMMRIESKSKERTNSALNCPESDDTEQFELADSLSENSLALESVEVKELKCAGAKLQCKDVKSPNSKSPEFTDSKVLDSPNSCSSVTEAELTGTALLETVQMATYPGITQEEMTDELADNSVPCTVDGPVQPPKAHTLTQTQLPATDSTDSRHLMATDTVHTETTGTGFKGMKTKENKEKMPYAECTETKDPNLSGILQDRAAHQKAESEQLSALVIAAEGPWGQMQEDMEPEKGALGLPLNFGAEQRKGGSPESPKHRSTMQEILSEIQSLVERSDVINRTKDMDSTRCMESSPSEPEIRLVRTVLKVLACRYQPAQLNITAMAKQLEEAEDYRRCVLEQVATMNSMSAAKMCDPDALKTVEGRWSAALLDASATVQVKAAQLDQVKLYHRQMKATRALLEVLAAEKEKTSLNILRSSVLQAESLSVLLRTLEQKTGMMEELLRLSSQLSVHLSEAESSGALLAQLGDVQEEWRLLEGSIKRALKHASNSSSQYSRLIKEAEQLQAKLESLQKSSTFMQPSQTIHDSKSTLEFACMTTDLKLYNQQYLHLQSQSDALGHFSLGRKEKDEVERVLRKLRSLLNVTKNQLDTSSTSIGGTSSAKINKHLKDLVIWAKQAENHMTFGKTLALFPEEARIQIVEMKKLQTDILTRRSNMQVEVEEIKALASNMEKEESDQVAMSLKYIEGLYAAIAGSSAHALDIMEKNLQEREKLLHQLTDMDAWLAEAHVNRAPYAHVDNISKANIVNLESKLRIHKLATEEIENQKAVVDNLAENSKEIAVGLSPAESRYLVNRLSGLWTELDGLLAHERAASWELEELIHERTASDVEFSNIQASLKQISSDLEQQTFPFTKDTLSTIETLKHMLMEHQCQIQELQHCQESKRSSLLCIAGELQDRSKSLSMRAMEQDKYLHLKKQMEDSRDIAEGQIQRYKDETLSVGERFKLCQTLLVELPLVKTQCQEAADQLEAIGQDLHPSQLNSERLKIRQIVETLVSWEHAVTDDIKNLEVKLLEGLHFHTELPALIEFFQRTRLELEQAEPVDPDEKAIDIKLQRCWVIWRNLESGMRVLDILGQKEKINPRTHGELYSLKDATMQVCHSHMESLSQARESLKDYHWAAQGAIGFLHNAEATFLSAPGGFLDCTEEQSQTQQALAALEDVLQAHVSHLVELVPQQLCLSRPKTEQLHIGILSQLLVGRATLEAQAQLRLDALQRCAKREHSHRTYHEDMRKLLSRFEARLSECAAEHVTSHEKCIEQQKRAKLLMEDIHGLAGKIEDLRAGCPMQGCGVGKNGELSALWRRWVSLRRGVGLLMAHSEQREEEWKDITASIKQCWSSLASLQAEMSDSSTVSSSQGEPQELLAQAEIHQAELEQEQQSLASLEHRLEHALSLSSPQDTDRAGPVGQRLVKIQENLRSLKEKNLEVLSSALAEEQERQQVQEEIRDVEQCVLAMLPALESCSNPRRQQELRKGLFSHKAKLQCIMDSMQSRYAEVPADISRQIQEVQLSLQNAEEKMLERSDPVRKLTRKVVELHSGLEGVKTLLNQRSPTIAEAQNTLKHVWDELDAWHSHLTLLESEAQDLAEEQPDQAHLLMDELIEPLQLYQDAAREAEQRTAFLSKIPASLQEFEDMLRGATCWLEEAQSWLRTPCSYTTARSLQSHANSLQLVIDDSKRIRATLEGFRPLLAEISAVCDISAQEEMLAQTDSQVQIMQHNIAGPLEQLLQAAAVVDAIETELKTMEKNLTKIRTILSSVDSSITLVEHLHNRQVILANLKSMWRTLEEMERCKGELGLPQGTEESLLVFLRASLLLQTLQELEQLTQQQAALLESKISEEEETEGTVPRDLSITTAEAFHLPEDTVHSAQQEAFQACNSEEEEEEEEESPLSSSSDTLTCSIPEDPEDTLLDQDLVATNASTVESDSVPEINLLSEVQAPETLASQFLPKAEIRAVTAATRPVFVKTVLTIKESGPENVGTGSVTMESRLPSKAEVYEASCPGTMTTDLLPTVAILAAEDQRTFAPATDQHGTPKREILVTDTDNSKTLFHQPVAAVEDTRFIPARPTTPFTPARQSGDKEEHLSVSKAPHQHLETLLEWKEQSGVSISPCGMVEESQQTQESLEMQIRFPTLAGNEEEEQRWSWLYSQISQKFTTLKKVQEEHSALGNSGLEEKVPGREVETTGSAAAVLQEAQECTALLRRLRQRKAAEISSAGVSRLGAETELHKALRRVLLCLDTLTDLLLTPAGAADDNHLKLLQQECVSAELVLLAEALNGVESETRPTLGTEESEALGCITCLQGCLRKAQLVLTSSQNQLRAHLGLPHQHQELPFNQLCVLDIFQLGQRESFHSLKDVPSLENVLTEHVKESPEEKAKLQQVSRVLLQGITRLLELGEECVILRPTSQSQLQPLLCRHKNLFQVLGSQVAFVQHLFAREPETLKSQEDDWVQLEVKVKALQQQALEQEVASQRRLQEWSRWGENCGRLGRLLDELEAISSNSEAEGRHDDEVQIQARLDACQQVLVQLDQCRAALGSVQDQGKVLQTGPEISTSGGQAGGTLELRWQSIYRRTEQEIQRCQDIQDSRARLLTDFAAISEWLVDANKHLETWSSLTDTTDLSQEHVHRHLTQLLDFTMQVEATSVQRASVSLLGTRLLHLREIDCPALQGQLAQLESSWSQFTSDVAKAQDRLQQLLLAGWPPLELLSGLEDKAKELEARLSQVKETVLKAKDAAQITETLQHHQELKAGLVSGQLLLDFLGQSGPRVAGADIQALSSQRTIFAERLGALNLSWLHLQGALGSQMRRAEEMHHTCADRERRLRRLHSWIAQQIEKLKEWQNPVSQTLAHKALLEWQAIEHRVKEVTAALQELRAIRVQIDKDEKEEDHPSDIAFIGQIDSVSQACAALHQQMDTLRPALQQTVEEWRCFERALTEVSVHTTRVRCALQHQKTPLLSLKQAQSYMDLLQQNQEKAESGVERWEAVEKSYQGLRKTVHHGTAQMLAGQVEGEHKRWKEVVQDMKEELLRTEQVLSLWQKYIQVSDHCYLRLQHLQQQWEALSSCLPTPQQDLQAVLSSVGKLQEDTEDLQSSVGDVLSTSKPLIACLEPLAANLIQSETRLLSRDVLLLSQTLSRKHSHLQEDLEQQKLFCTSLKSLENQTQSILEKLKARVNDMDHVKQIHLELSDLLPSLIDISEMSCHVTHCNQEAERLQALCRQWTAGLSCTSDMNREMQAEIQRSQNFQQKCENLVSVQEKLEQDLMAKKAESYSSLQEMLTVHRKLQPEIMVGHHLLQGLLHDAVECLENKTEEKRSELMGTVGRVRESWLKSVALAGQCKALAEEHLDLWRIYKHGMKLLWKLLRDVDPLLPPASQAPCTLQQLQSYMDNCRRVEETLDLHSATYNQTVEAGRQLCTFMTESQCQSRLQAELQAIEEAWEESTTLLRKRRTLLSTITQKWSQCQDGITNRIHHLDELQSWLKRPLPDRLEQSQEETAIQEKEVSLECLASGLREMATMKMDLSQYVAAGDSALLEQQLEQLHCQWEELCMKVSLRRQEIADRLNAWTIFNDKNKELCDWLAQMENKVCHSGDLSIEEMVEKLKKDCMEEINLFSENKSHLKQLGEQLLLASDQAKQTQVHGSLQEVSQRWHNLFQHIEARVKKLKETLVTVQQLDKNMSNLRSWLSRMEAELSRPITYSVCHHQEIQRRLAEQQELQRDIEQHTEGVASVLSLCDVLLRDEDAAGGTEAESDSLQETSRSLDQRWRTICAMALDRRLRIEETWRLWCKFLDDYSRFEDWLKMAERTAANPNSADVLYTVAKEELKKFEGFQRQVHERLTQLELVNNQYRRLARENRTDRASQLKAMVHEGNRRWDTLHRRVAAILRRLKYFTGQREDFEGTRESMVVWLTELDLQLTNVEHFSESDVHHKIQQLNSFQEMITVNTERIDGLIVFGEGLIQKSSPQDAALIEEELEELHSYCQEVFSRLVRFHQRLSQPPTIKEEPELSGASVSLEESLELICRPWLGRSPGSLPATPTHLLASPLERSGRETPVSVDSLPLEWDHTGDVGGSSSHEDEEEEEEHEEEGTYFSALSVSSRSMATHESPRWRSAGDPESEPLQLDTEIPTEALPTLTSTPLKQGYLRLMSQCSGSIENIKRVSLILDEEEQQEELGLTGLTATDKQSGVIERWELLQAQSRSGQQAGPREPQQLTSDLSDITSWLEHVVPELERLQQCDQAVSIEDMSTRAKQLKEMQKMFARYKSVMLSVNLGAQEAPELQESLSNMNHGWSRASTSLQECENSLRKTLMRCQEFHETLHSLLLWLAHAESRRYAVDISHPDTPVRALRQHRNTLTGLEEELQGRQAQLASLQALWSQLQPEEGSEESGEAQEKLHVTGNKLKLLLRQVGQDLGTLQQRLAGESASSASSEGADQGQSASLYSSQGGARSQTSPGTKRENREPSPPRSFFYRVLRAAFPLHLLLLLLLLLPCLIPMSESDPSCTVTNNFARSFYPMLRYTNGPPPT